MRQKNQLLRAMAWCAYERFAVQQSYKMLFMYSFVYIAQHWKSISHLLYEKNEFCVTISEINNLKSGRTASVLRYRTIGNKRFVCLESAINMLPDYFVIRRRWGINMCCKSPVAQFFKKSIVCIDYVNCFLVATELSHLWTLHRPIVRKFFK